MKHLIAGVPRSQRMKGQNPSKKRGAHASVLKNQRKLLTSGNARTNIGLRLGSFGLNYPFIEIPTLTLRMIGMRVKNSRLIQRKRTLIS